MDKVSIVVPVYCVEKFLPKCTESILTQTYSELELLLIDDGSTDRSGEICDEYADLDKRVKVIHKKNGGVSTARNIGIRHASGKYMMFVDADDWIEPDTILNLVDYIHKDNLDICFSNAYYKDENKVIRIPFPFQPKENPISAKVALQEHLQYKITASVCLALFNRKVIEKNEFDKEIHTLEDWEYLVRVLADSNCIGICDYAFYHYRTVMGSASKSALNEKKMTCFKIPDKVRKYLRNNHLDFLLEYADGLESIFLNHIMVIEANSNEKKSIYNNTIKKIARENLGHTLRNKHIMKRQKIYCILIAITPELFKICYRFKYGRKV